MVHGPEPAGHAARPLADPGRRGSFAGSGPLRLTVVEKVLEQPEMGLFRVDFSRDFTAAVVTLLHGVERASATSAGRITA
jgi:hypothetical protein